MDPPTFCRDLLSPDEAVYPSREEAIKAVREHAKWHGYAISVTKQNGTKNCHIRCSKWRVNVSRIPMAERQRQRRSAGKNCPWEMRVLAVRRGSSQEVYTSMINTNHNHLAFLKPEDHHMHRAFNESIKENIALQVGRGVTAATLLSQHQEELGYRKDFQNACQRERKALQLGLLPVAGLLQWLPVNGFITHECHDSNNTLTALFITTQQCINMTRQFGSVLLMDATYKVNQYNMPLFHMVGFDCNYRTFTAGWCFLSNEDIEAYSWTLGRLAEHLHPHGGPQVIVTDRELALMAAIEIVFPRAKHMLCIWHINQNILANCRKKLGSNEAWAEFEADTKNMMYANTTEVYYEMMESFTQKYSLGKPREAVEYCKRSWFNKYPDKFIYAFSTGTSTFNSRATSRVEGAHATVKKFLRSSGANLNENCISLKESLRVQHNENYATMARCYGWLPPWVLEPEYNHMFSQIVDKVSHYALDLCRFEWIQASREIQEGNEPTLPCGCRALNDWGVPCQHHIYHMRGTSTPFSLNDFDIHWHLPTDTTVLQLWPTDPAPAAIQSDTQDLAAPSSNTSPPVPNTPPTEPARRRRQGERIVQPRTLSQFENVLQEIGVTASQLNQQNQERRQQRRTGRRRNGSQLSTPQVSHNTQSGTSSQVRRTLTIAQVRTLVMNCVDIATRNNASKQTINAGRIAAHDAALCMGSTPFSVISAFAQGMQGFVAGRDASM